MYRHSLFFLTEEDALQAETVLTSQKDGDTDIDGVFVDSDTIEYSFQTTGKLDDYDQRSIFRKTQPSSYAFNCEVYQTKKTRHKGAT